MGTTMISEHIENLITAAKEMPKSESKNRGLSHLKDALAHFKVMEMENEEFIRKDPIQAIGEQFLGLGNRSQSVCICKHGLIRIDCPVHGVKAG